MIAAVTEVHLVPCICKADIMARRCTHFERYVAVL
jgi:hypothetical protein